MTTKLRKVGELAAQVRGVTYRKQDAEDSARPGYLPVLRAGNIEEHGLTFGNLVYVPSSKVSERQRLRKNDILIAASSGSIDVVGKAARALRDYDGGFGAFCKVLRPNGEVDPGFFAHYFKTPEYRRRVSFLAAGASINNLRNEDLDNLEIPLPPLAEQKRIAGILDAADALRAKRREALAQLDTLLQATFLDLFRIGRPPISIGPVRFGNGARFVPLSTVAELATGHTPDREVPHYWGGDIPWISLTDIRALDGTIAMETGQNVTEKGLEHSSSVLLPARTVCLSRTASIGFVTVMGREMATSQDFVNWMCGERLDPMYLMWALRISRPYLLSKASGSTHKTIYYRHAEQFEVHLPPIADQKRFAAIVESVDAQKPAHRMHLAELDILFASLQSRAFRGKL